MATNICITSYEAIKWFREAKVQFVIEDDGSLLTTTPNNGYKRTRRFKPVDSIGSLYERDAIKSECIYWLNRESK